MDTMTEQRCIPAETFATVMFRADASDAIGSGHVMRCLALAQLFQPRGFRCLFAVEQCPAPLVDRLRNNGCEVLLLEGDDEAGLARHVEQQGAAAVILDGYHFSPEYRRQLLDTAAHVLAIDDAVDDAPLHAHAVLNSSPLARQADYVSRAPQAMLFLGPEYTPLRQEFLSCDSDAASLSCDRLLLTFGGSDILNIGPQLIPRLMPRLPETMQVDWVIGGPGPDQASLDELRGRWPNLIPHRNVSDMATLMAHSCAAVFAAGSTLLELAYMGVPGVGVVVADNQSPALQPPYTDWFRVFDMRQNPGAIDQVVSATLGLIDDASAREAQRLQLRQLGVASKTPTIPQRLLDA